MQLALSTWPEIEAYLKRSDGIIIPTGSTEQHGPTGLIGTDALCAQDIANEAAQLADGLVAPVLGYTPAPFNMSFPGTVSVSQATFKCMVREIAEGLIHHGFRHLYVLNAHGANLEPVKNALNGLSAKCRVRSWWDFEPVNRLRQDWYGDWEGMHATPSEISMTQARYRVIDSGDLGPPEKLSADYIMAHSGDRHGPPDEHRAQFPDGRVGSHSGLARKDHGEKLFDAACRSVAYDFQAFLDE